MENNFGFAFTLTFSPPYAVDLKTAIPQQCNKAQEPPALLLGNSLLPMYVSWYPVAASFNKGIAELMHSDIEQIKF